MVAFDNGGLRGMLCIISIYVVLNRISFLLTLCGMEKVIFTEHAESHHLMSLFVMSAA